MRYSRHMADETRAFFEGRDPAGRLLFTLYPPAAGGVTDNQLHIVPDVPADRKHLFSDDCWCIPRVEFKGAAAERAAWIYTHQVPEKRHSDGRSEHVRREDARQGGLVTGIPAADERERPDRGEASTAPAGNQDVEEGGGDWWDDGMFVT
ncbi:hypothetical protein SEA_SPEEDDEMON_10 [Gordonia phage SpeedDemon]|nr:hypothetical protein SEA_SPEEDDEMON_10 [Gordonia phage SpeedDemon]